MALQIVEERCSVTWGQLEERMEAKGFEQLGSGSFATVLAKKDSKQVYKLCKSADNLHYIEYIRVCSLPKYRGNPYLPKASLVQNIIPPVKYSRYSIIQIERLKEYKRVNWNLLNAIEAITQMSVRLADINEWCWDSEDELRDNIKDEIKSLRVNKQHKQWLGQYAEIIERVVKVAGGSEDIHNENVMLRDRQLVITDPLA